MLAITFWFHWTHAYGNVALTVEGMIAVLFMAALGAGPLSLDRAILKREF